MEIFEQHELVDLPPARTSSSDRVRNGLLRRPGRHGDSFVRNGLLPALALRRRPRRPMLDPPATRCDAGVPPPRGSSDAAQPSGTLFHSPLISLPHINPLSHTTSHPFASLAGSRRHRGRPVLRPLFSRMWAVLGAVWSQREPHAQNCTLHLLGVSVLGRVAACMLVFRPAVEPCPCRAMSVRVRGACPCTAVVHLRVCT